MKKYHLNSFLSILRLGNTLFDKFSSLSLEFSRNDFEMLQVSYLPWGLLGDGFQKNEKKWQWRTSSLLTRTKYIHDRVEEYYFTQNRVTGAVSK